MVGPGDPLGEIFRRPSAAPDTVVVAGVEDSFLRLVLAHIQQRLLDGRVAAHAE